MTDDFEVHPVGTAKRLAEKTHDQDYIRKAVELADGFQLTNDDRYFSLPHGGYVPVIDGCQQQYLDALAAQLVRQVDALVGFDIRVTEDGVQMWELLDGGQWELTRTKGPDRTMNTIKAIVDSKVLE